MIETDASGVKYIKWTTPTGVIGNTTKSIIMDLYPDDFGAGYEVFLISDGSGAGSNELISVSTVITTGKFGFIVDFSGTNGIWITTSATLTAGARNQIGISYDGGATTNDPVFYLNGASVAITETSTPTGTFKTGTSADLYLNSLTSGSNIDGKIGLCSYHNVILSADEFLEAYNSRLAIPITRGLVFNPSLVGASGLQTFDGSTLAAGNTIADQVNGYLGVPSGSPIAVADTLLTYR